MRDEDLRGLREHLGREPSPMERTTWAQRLRLEREGHSGPTLEERLRTLVSDLGKRHPADVVRESLLRHRENLLVPADVGSGLPMGEDAIRAVYDGIIGDLPAA